MIHGDAPNLSHTLQKCTIAAPIQILSSHEKSAYYARTEYRKYFVFRTANMVFSVRFSSSIEVTSVVTSEVTFAVSLVIEFLLIVNLNSFCPLSYLVSYRCKKRIAFCITLLACNLPEIHAFPIDRTPLFPHTASHAKNASIRLL